MFLYVDVGEIFMKFSYTKTSTTHALMCEAIVVVISGMTTEPSLVYHISSSNHSKKLIMSFNLIQLQLHHILAMLSFTDDMKNYSKV